LGSFATSRAVALPNAFIKGGIAAAYQDNVFSNNVDPYEGFKFKPW